jgi:hypothetical protein
MTGLRAGAWEAVTCAAAMPNGAPAIRAAVKRESLMREISIRIVEDPSLGVLLRRLSTRPKLEHHAIRRPKVSETHGLRSAPVLVQGGSRSISRDSESERKARGRAATQSQGRMFRHLPIFWRVFRRP